MAEVVRFRVARSVRRLAESERAIYRILKPGENPSAFLLAIRELISSPLGDGDDTAKRTNLILKIAKAAASIVADESVNRLLKFLGELDLAILKFVPAPTPKEFDKLLTDLLWRVPLDGLPAGQSQSPSKLLTNLGVWAITRGVLGDKLVFLHLVRLDNMMSEGHRVTGDVVNVQGLNRLLLLMGLIEAVADGGFALQTSEDLADLVFRRTVLLPSPPFPLQTFVPLIAATRFARRPGFVDLTVVRDEWSCYVPGEVAHIENVMKGEFKERAQKILEEREITDVREDGSLQVRENSTEKSEQSAFKEDVQRELQLSVALEGQLDLSGSYGTVQFAAHMGAEVELGYTQTERRIAEQAREVVERVVNRQEERVRRVRTERSLRRTEEQNMHTLDNSNSPSGHVVAIYRWVDKIIRLRNFVYPNRYVFEFQLAQPGARLRWLQETQAPPEMLTPVPPSLTVDGSAVSAALSPQLISRNNYLQLVGIFRAQGVPDPQPSTIDIAGVIELKSEQALPTDTFQGIQNIPRAVGKADLGIPPGYLGVLLRATIAAVPQLGKWRDAPEQGGDFYEDMVGYHAILATVTAGSARVNLRNAIVSVQTSFNSTEGIRLPDMWEGVPNAAIYSGETEIAGPLSGTVPVAATFAGSFSGHATVAIKCQLSEEAEGEWRLTVYQRLVSAYQEWRARYDDERRNQEVMAGETISGQSPAKNRQRIQEELKRQIIELIIARDFHGYPLLRSIDQKLGPLPDFETLKDVTPTIQFLEQAFEWQNMSYVPYPFYWGDRGGWPALERIQYIDADLERFLRSGSARVVVPARPGYEYAVEYYTVFGEPWSGGAAPTPDEPLYISVAQEIRELTSGANQGKPGDMWESKQPTTLIWLDSDSSMPKRNENLGKAFEGLPEPKLSPDAP